MSAIAHRAAVQQGQRCLGRRVGLGHHRAHDDQRRRVVDHLAQRAARARGHDRELELVGEARLLGQRPAQHLVAHLHRVDVVRLPDRRRAGVAAQVKAHHDAEVAGARAAGGPQPLGVRVLVGVDQLALGGDDVDADDAHAGRPDHARQPTPPALEQEATQADGGAVARGEEQPVVGEQAVELAAAHPGLDDGGPRSRGQTRRSGPAARGRSAARPRRTLEAVQLWPPERALTLRSCARARRTASTTSSTEEASTIACG